MALQRSRYSGKNLPIPNAKRKAQEKIYVPSANEIRLSVVRGARLAVRFGSIGPTQIYRKPSIYFSSLVVRHEMDERFVDPLLAFLDEKRERVNQAGYHKTRDILRAQIAKQRIDEKAERARSNGEASPLQNKYEIAFTLGRFCLDTAAAIELGSTDTAVQGWGFRQLMSTVDETLRATIFASAVYAAPQLLPPPEPPKPDRRQHIV